MLLGILVFAFPWTPRLAYLQKWDGFRLLSGKPSGTLAQIPLLAQERMKKVTDLGVGKKKRRQGKGFQVMKGSIKVVAYQDILTPPSNPHSSASLPLPRNTELTTNKLSCLKTFQNIFKFY